MAWWVVADVNAVAILAQGTSLAVAAKQALCFKASNFVLLLGQTFLDQPGSSPLKHMVSTRYKWASSGIRAHDLPLTERALYQLSYRGKLVDSIWNCWWLQKPTTAITRCEHCLDKSFKGLWRNGSASDSRSEGWEFESLWPHFEMVS